MIFKLFLRGFPHVTFTFPNMQKAALGFHQGRAMRKTTQVSRIHLMGMKAPSLCCCFSISMQLLLFKTSKHHRQRRQRWRCANQQGTSDHRGSAVALDSDWSWNRVCVESPAEHRDHPCLEAERGEAGPGGAAAR